MICATDVVVGSVIAVAVMFVVISGQSAADRAAVNPDQTLIVGLMVAVVALAAVHSVWQSYRIWRDDRRSSEDRRRFLSEPPSGEAA